MTDSRPAHESVVRRRECLSCHQRFTTAETIDTLKLKGNQLPHVNDEVQEALENYWRGCGD